MKKTVNVFTIKNAMVLGFLLMLLCITVLSVNDANAFPRKPLFEDFTSTTCPPCAAAAPSLFQAFDDIGHENFGSIAIHGWWPAPGNDPWFLRNEPHNRGRIQYYSVNSLPTYFIDGAIYNGNRTRDAFRNAIQQRFNVDTPIEIIIQANVVGDEIRMAFEVTSEQNLNNLTLFVAVNEFYYSWRAPTNQMDHYDSMLQMVPNHNGTQFNIGADRTLSFEFTQSLEDINWHETPLDNIVILAWVAQSNRSVLQSESFKLSFNSPMIVVDGVEFDDRQNGNGDNRPEAGESIELVTTFKNMPNYLQAENVIVTVSTSDEGIEITNGRFEFNGLEAGNTTTNVNSPFTFNVAEDFEARPVTFEFSLKVQPGDMDYIETYTTMIDWPQFLLVNASGGEQYGNMLFEKFGENGLPWADMWNRDAEGILPGDLMMKYDALIWHTFNTTDDIGTEFEIEFLTDYLNSGGSLIMSSHTMLVDEAYTAFFRDFTKTSVNEAHITASFINGNDVTEAFTGSTIFLGGGASAGFPSRKPTLNVLEGAREVLYYRSNQGARIGTAAVSYSTDNYRTLVLAFPMESIGGIQDTEDLTTFIGRITNWLDEPLSVPENEVAQPLTFALNPAYPNPFNPSTSLNFSMDRNGTAEIALFDIAGKKVADIVEGAFTAGVHTVSIDASKLGLTGGLYMVRLKNDDRVALQKVLFLK